ncbi:hypothetical protein AOQ84DRAFT_407616 [Glonium stellatum]|uniref:Uncharacterized protein n=1 Tax=Glonium stellatum TaxID=574774 RepID=A0A8E2JT02_9PEZI|nr:hypothetical protein AOQ84DRAFT_407616 [Glonium stellatum]
MADAEAGNTTCLSNQLLCQDNAKSPPTLYCLTVTDTYTCSVYRDCFQQCQQLKANPDIAGKGVIISFIITAGLTLVFSTAYLLIRAGALHNAAKLPDKRLPWSISKFSQNIISHARRELLADCLLKIVLSFSDQQLAVGLAMLFTGIYMFVQTSISVYHFSIVMDLAWFSSNTHLLSLIVLKDYLSKKAKKKNRSFGKVSVKNGSEDEFDEGFLEMKILRTVLMLLLFGMMVFGSVISGYRNWYEEASCPANCVPRSQIGGVPEKWMIVNIFLLCWGYPVQILNIFKFSRQGWLNCKVRINHIHMRVLKALRDNLFFWLYWVVVGAFRLLWAFLGSTFAEILQQIAWFIVGVVSVIGDRKWGHGVMSQWSETEAQTEDSLGFGQLVPLLLLVLPFMMMAEAYHDSAENLPARQVTEDGIPMQHLAPPETVPDTAQVSEPEAIEPNQQLAATFLRQLVAELKIGLSILPPY